MDEGALRAAACRINVELARRGLVVLAFGNASVIDRSTGVVAIKPSGVACADVGSQAVVLVDLATGRPLRGTTRPSIDTPTHLALYRALPGVGAVIHTHSPSATSWAQSGRPLPCLGTSHADHFRGSVPVTRALTEPEIDDGYEANTGRRIVECFANEVDAQEIPAALVVSHGPFVWGEDPASALDNATALEHAATVALGQAVLGPLGPIPGRLRDHHFDRKHGRTATYGQTGSSVVAGSAR
jgi:L-ribulose-5-phosphate 4-epimerase